MKLYTEYEIFGFLKMHHSEGICAATFMKNLTPIQLPIDKDMEEKLDVAYGNGYEQGEMDLYKKMQCKGDKYAEGYSEGYKRALELVKHKIDNDLQGGNK